MVAILDMLKSRREKRAADAHELARRLAAGETIDPDLIVTACDAANMGDEDFLALVDLHTRRNDLRKQASTGPAARQELQAIEASLAKHKADFEEAERRYAAAVRPLVAQKSDAEHRAAAAAAAESALASTTHVPKELARRVEECKREAYAASSALQRTQAHLEKQTRRHEDAEKLIMSEGDTFEKLERLFRNEEQRHLLSNASTRLVQEVIRGRNEAAAARDQLPALVAASRAADAALQAAEKACRDF